MFSLAIWTLSLMNVSVSISPMISEFSGSQTAIPGRKIQIARTQDEVNSIWFQHIGTLPADNSFVTSRFKVKSKDHLFLFMAHGPCSNADGMSCKFACSVNSVLYVFVCTDWYQTRSKFEKSKPFCFVQLTSKLNKCIAIHANPSDGGRMTYSILGEANIK